jgi:hypothetical protein
MYQTSYSQFKYLGTTGKNRNKVHDEVRRINIIWFKTCYHIYLPKYSRSWMQNIVSYFEERK